ncbi:MAG: hypothetical protein R3B45_14505 [Bdellovibrionota bacterium]
MTDQSFESMPLDWPDGWFIFDQGKVQGPLTTKQVFGDSADKTVPGHSMVSRRGFSRWYSLAELKDVYKKGNHMGIANLATITDVEDELSAAVGKLSKLHSEVRESRKNSLLEIKQIETQLSKNTNFNSPASSISYESAVGEGVISSNEAKTETLLGKRAAKKPNPLIPSSHDDSGTGGLSTATKVSYFQFEGRHRQNVKKIGISRKNKEHELAYHHMILAGRLRLGALNSPWLEAYVKFFGSLGLYWGIWLRRTALATTMHLNGSSIKKSGRIFWLSFIPGYHMIMGRKVAAAVLSLETQNGYRTVSPTLAMFLSIFPPFVIYYLQSALNKHWELHIMKEVSEGD